MTEGIKILLSDDQIFAVSKPPGIPFHGTGKEKGILQIIREMETEGKIQTPGRLYPVHRLDKITSGILIFACGRKNANLLSNEFRHGRAEKYYAALSNRTPYKKKGRISGDMERGRNSTYILTRNHNHPAITFFQSFSLSKIEKGLRLYVVRPKTGRTHQIRVALKSISAPILGDGLYSRFDLARKEERAYLHACALHIKLNEKHYWILDPPSGGKFDHPEFVKFWMKLGKPWDLDWPFDRKRIKSPSSK